LDNCINKIAPNRTGPSTGDAINWSKIAGFNYQPSYGCDALDIWLNKFDEEVIRRELTGGKSCFPAMNTVRLWLSHEPFYRNPELFIDHFEKVLSICGKLSLQAIPVLFNNWHSFPEFGGISPELIHYWFKEYGQMGDSTNYLFKPYLDAIWSRYTTDNRILAWDLCNEPYNNFCPEMAEWLAHTYRWGKRMDVRQPISVSLQSDLAQLRECRDFCDVFMIHPYFTTEENILEVLAYAKACGKGCIATECCWGSLDDEARVAFIRNDLSILSAHGIGFLPHALQESKVGDLHRPRYAAFGIVSSASYMAFINMDGSLRPGHGVYNEYCQS